MPLSMNPERKSGLLCLYISESFRAETGNREFLISVIFLGYITEARIRPSISVQQWQEETGVDKNQIAGVLPTIYIYIYGIILVKSD